MKKKQRKVYDREYRQEGDEEEETKKMQIKRLKRNTAKRIME